MHDNGHGNWQLVLDGVETVQKRVWFDEQVDVWPASFIWEFCDRVYKVSQQWCDEIVWFVESDPTQPNKS